MPLTVDSTSFAEGEPVPERYAFGVPAEEGHAAPKGGNRSPHLRWTGAPAGTRSFAVAVVDEDVPADMRRLNDEDDSIEPDAPRQSFAHWLVADIPAEVQELAEGAGGEGIQPHGKPTGATSFGGITGANTFTEFLADDEEMAGTYGNYDGPFPPWNDELVHRYRFRVYALDTQELGLSGDFTLADFEQAVEGHVLERVELVGTYSLNPDAG